MPISITGRLLETVSKKKIRNQSSHYKIKENVITLLMMLKTYKKWIMVNKQPVIQEMIW